MKKAIFGFAVLFTHMLVSLVVAGNINPPPYPPQHWYLSVNFDFSKEAMSQFVDIKPEDDFFFMPSLNLTVFDDGKIHGNSGHPVLTRQINEGNGWMARSLSIGFTTSNDLSRIYHSAFYALNSFLFTEQYAPPGLDFAARAQVASATSKVLKKVTR